MDSDEAPVYEEDEDEQQNNGRNQSDNDDNNDDEERNANSVAESSAVAQKIKEKRRKKLIKESAALENRGVCYLSRIPPHMKPLKLRQILSQYGEVLRIYLAPEDPSLRMRRKQAGGNRGKEFTEGWAEFEKKSVAKRVAKMLNGEQIGGKRRSSHYYDLWNIKYLRKFKWDDLTGELALRRAVREQKLAMEVSVVNKQKNFITSKVEQSRAIKSAEERMKKKQKRDTGALSTSEDVKASSELIKPLRYFPQKKSVMDKLSESSPRLSTDVLKGVFGEV